VSGETDRRARLRAARLYFICDARPGGRALAQVLPGALAGGVDVFQLRDKRLNDEALLELALAARRCCDEHGALFILNDRADLAAAAGADGVHVGQDDVAVEGARAIVGDQRIVGLSTHTTEQIDATRGVDYIGVGPVNETPTKPGRPAVGVELVRYAAAHAPVPFFAIGGITAQNVAAVAEAGAQRVAVVRAIAEAADPAAAARTLRAALQSVATSAGSATEATTAPPTRTEASVGAT
jgi:thiamine-phosphate pyrophosphorylase